MRADVADRRGSSYIGVSGLVGADTVRRRQNAETFSFALFSRVPRRRAGLPSHVLVVNHRYWGEWVFWTGARLGDRRLPFSTLDLNVTQCAPRGGCGHDEGFMLGIPDDVLRARRSGFTVRLSSRTRREGVLRITSSMVAEQLRVIDSVRTVARR